LQPDSVYVLRDLIAAASVFQRVPKQASGHHPPARLPPPAQRLLRACTVNKDPLWWVVAQCDQGTNPQSTEQCSGSELSAVCLELEIRRAAVERRLDLSVGDPPGHQQHQHVVIWQLSCAVAAVGDMQVQHPPLRVQQIQSGGGHGTSHSRIATALPAPGLRSPLMRDAISEGGGVEKMDSSRTHDAE